MSGGSMNHLYCRVRDVTFKAYTPERQAFVEHLKLVAKALHDIEWVDSGDYGPGRENEAIRACLTSADERKLRRIYAYRVAMPHLYMDDGEASGSEHGIQIDFMREPVSDIAQKGLARGVATETRDDIAL